MADLLPESLILEVLSRLPVKAIIRCKRVCKKWRDLVSSPYFVGLHLSRSPEALMIDKCNSWPSATYIEWVVINHLDPVKSINLNFYAPEYYYGIQVGSVNGLICTCYGSYSYAICIFNPIVEECMGLPAQPLLENHVVLSYGFGVSMAGEYKVMRICGNPCETEAFAVEIDVYTLGTGQWRGLGQTPYRLKKLEPGVFVNSHVYWLGDGRVYGFDLNTETFGELLPSPPGPAGESKQMLGVLKGRLSRVSWSLLGLEVWVMKEESWCKEIAIQENLSFFLKTHPLCLADGLKGTSILMVYDQATTELVAYCLNTNTILHLNWRGYLYRMITYRPSFVKLEKFGSERVYAVYNRGRRIATQ